MFVNSDIFGSVLKKTENRNLAVKGEVFLECPIFIFM